MGREIIHYAGPRRTKGEYAILPLMKPCIISFVDTDGLRHSVELEANSLYEAAALAVRTFRQHGCGPGSGTRLEVEVRSAVTHTITLKKLEDWIAGRARSPKETLAKEKVKR